MGCCNLCGFVLGGLTDLVVLTVLALRFVTWCRLAFWILFVGGCGLDCW